jgi:hypothetical protein
MPPQLLGTLFGLADHADKQGRSAYPSVRTLAAYACKAERSVQRDLKELIKLGLIRDGDQSAASHIPQERRPHVYDLAIEITVPGGRAGDDGVTQASRVTLTSSRARGGRKAAARHEVGVTPTSGGDAHVTPDAHDTPGVTPTSEWGDAHVAGGVTPTSPKPSFEPPTNRPLNQERAGAASNPAATPASGGLHTIPDDFHLNDTMRRWAVATYPHLNPEFETAQFISYWRSEGRRKRNWHDAWQKWIRDSGTRAATQPRQGAFLVPLPGGGQQQLTGTDAKVAGWHAIAAQLAEKGDSA